MLNFDGGFQWDIALKFEHTMNMKTEFLFVSSSDSFCLIASHMYALKAQNQKPFIMILLCYLLHPVTGSRPQQQKAKEMKMMD